MAPRSRPRSTPAALQLQVDRFNESYSVGQRVSVRLDNGDKRETTTRSHAAVLSGHSAVIWLEGISGCYLLDRVNAISDEAPVSRPRTEQFSAEEMRAALGRGDTVQQIYARAYRMDRSVTKEAVRAILFDQVQA